MTSKTFNALANEAGLAAGHLMVGVTALGKANYAEKAYYYQAFFSLATGIERTCKLIFICDHFLQNGNTFPTEKLVRDFGHDLQQLVDRVAGLSRAGSLKYQKPGSAIHKDIMRILSTFATNGTRYYNIDSVVGKTLTHEDPLADWYRSVVRPCWEGCVKPSSRRKVELNASIVGDSLRDLAWFQHTSEEGVGLSEARDAALTTGIWEKSAPYVRLHTLQWCRFFGQLISSYSYAHEDIPIFSDFYGRFHNDDTYLKSRKSWALRGG